MLKRFFLFVLCSFLLVSAVMAMGEKPATEKSKVSVDSKVLLSKIQIKLKAQALMSDEELGQFMTALRNEYEARKNSLLKGYSLEERTRLMLQEGPVSDTVAECLKAKLMVKEMARIAISASAASAKDSDRAQIRETLQLCLQNKVASNYCAQLLEETGETPARLREMDQFRDMAREMLNEGLRGEGLVEGVRQMVRQINAGETPRQARLKVMTEIRLMLKAGKKENDLVKGLGTRENLQIRERTRLMEGTGTGEQKRETIRKETEGQPTKGKQQ